jgi:pimeloyl-ACP methyl ester carboxylesterase
MHNVYAHVALARSRSHPVLVANGDNDRMVPTPNSYLLAEHISNARLNIYPDAGHGFLFQHPEKFAAEVNAFLGGVYRLLPDGG